MDTATETWLDVMPVIPLAKAVPVRATDGEGIDVALLGVGGRYRMAFSGWQDGLVVRVDLDDPQGFGYALRHMSLLAGTDPLARATMADALDELGGFDAHLHRHLHGKTTEDDRLRVARTLAEVA